MNDSPKEKIALADQLAAWQKTDLFQFVIGPLIDEKAGLTHAYKLKAKEAERFDGLWEGLDRVFQVMQRIEDEGETARLTLRAEEERAARNKAPEDSTDL